MPSLGQPSLPATTSVQGHLARTTILSRTVGEGWSEGSGLGVADNRVYVDHGLTGTNRERPGLREALAACREGDTLLVTKLDRLARSLPDARAIADELTVRQVRLNLGGSVCDPTDPVGRLLFNVLAMVAEFESDLIRLRTRD